MARNAKLRDKQKWAIEKPKLDNARRLQGIYFIDPEDKELKETMQEKQVWGFKSKFACILEASEFTRRRVEESLPKYREDRIAGKEDNSLQHYNLVHKFIPMPQAMKILAAKAAVDKEWEKLEKIPAWDRTKSETNQK